LQEQRPVPPLHVWRVPHVRFTVTTKQWSVGSCAQ
jgi:hypothetical protein